MKRFPRRVRLSLAALLGRTGQSGLAGAGAGRSRPARPIAPSATFSAGSISRWWLGAFVWVIRKFGGPFFRDAARSIQNAIRGAAAGRAAAERELNEANAATGVAGCRNSGDAARRQPRIGQRSGALAGAGQQRSREDCQGGRWRRSKPPERAAQQQLRAMAARAATDRAAVLVRQRMNEQAERALFGSFLGELERGAQ